VCGERALSSGELKMQIDIASMVVLEAKKMLAVAPGASSGQGD
jgi:hypothetical protein